MLVKRTTVEISLSPGMTISDAACDLVAWASRLNAVCRANFNGVLLYAGGEDDPVELVRAWHAATAGKQLTASTSASLDLRIRAEAAALAVALLPSLAPAEGSA